MSQAMGYDQAGKAVQRHVDEGDGTKHTLIDFLGRNYKRDDVAKRDTATSSLYP